MTPEEARLILNGWWENHSQLALVGQFWGFRLVLRCRVHVVSDDEAVLATSDGGCIGVAISEPGTGFGYAELREFPKLAEQYGWTKEQQFRSSLTILFPSRTEDDDPGSLSFLDLGE